MKKFKINNQTLTEEQISDIIIDGIEDGVSYWGLIHNDTEEFENGYKNTDKTTSEIAADIILNGGAVEITDIEEEEEPLYKLTLDRLLKGIEKNAEFRTWDSDLDDYDACTVDCIIQYAIFDDVIFG